MIIDKLYREIEKKGPISVGLDIDINRLPRKFKESHQDVDEIIFNFNKEVIDATRDLVPVYKLQIAHYESQGLKGLIGYSRSLKYLKSQGLISIADVKRGDISSTGSMYAKAHFTGDFEADFLTLNPYMGFDSISPYLEYLEKGNKGIFVLIRTSNPGAKDIEYLESQGKPVYYHVGDGLREIGKDYMGACGYSLIGGVVGGTHLDEAEEIRERYKNMMFLIPGYGAQGGGGLGARSYLRDNNGGLVNSSRGIIRAFESQKDEGNYLYYIKEAVKKMREDILNV